MGPAIHQRQLATAVWLRTGLSDTDEDIPRRYVLAACERVLELKKTVVDSVRRAAKSLTPETAEQLELLLSEDRSVQVMMDKTLGVSSVVSSSNVGSLVDAMKAGLTAEVRQEAADEIAAIRRQTSARVIAESRARREAEVRAATFSEAARTADAEDLCILENLVAEVNRSTSRSRRVLKGLIMTVVTVLGVAPLLSESLNGWRKVPLLAAAGVIDGVLAFFHLLDRPLGLDGILLKWSNAKLHKLADRRGYGPKLARAKITNNAGVISVTKPEDKSADTGFELTAETPVPSFRRRTRRSPVQSG